MMTKLVGRWPASTEFTAPSSAFGGTASRSSLAGLSAFQHLSSSGKIPSVDALASKFTTLDRVRGSHLADGRTRLSSDAAMLHPDVSQVLRPELLYAAAGRRGREALSSAPRIWNPAKACFEAWVLPYGAAIPLVVAALTVVILVLRPILPRPPRWTRNFIKEYPNIEDDAEPVKPPRTYWMPALLVFSFIGLAFQAALLRSSPHDLAPTFATISWAVSIVLLVLIRPQTVPVSLLVLYCCMFLSQLAILNVTQASSQTSARLEFIQPVISLIIILIIICMPLRDPTLTKQGISPPFAIPDRNLRSPEDNLTTWQWMTVSWMTPLMGIGQSRQLNEDDVWFLPYEFQHRRLHDTFRLMRGSVIGRLLRANGIDLIVSTLLGFLDIIANSLGPVLLQKLLQVMEDPEAPRRAAITYAALFLALHLFASQVGVFELWFARRGYERSRGEMITMLYEKTLARKMVSSVPTDEISDTPNGASSTPNGHYANGANGGDVNNPPTTKGDRDKLRRLLHTISRVSRLPARVLRKRSRDTTKAEKKLPASLGKILNLMRNDAYEVAQQFWDCKDFFTVPLQVIVSTVLIWKMLGWPCLIGAVTLVIAQPINAILARILVAWEKRRRVATDKKLQVVSQFVEAIRHLRWYAWQGAWQNEILEKRRQELNLLVVSKSIRLAIRYVHALASQMFPVVAFWAYAVLAGRPLRIDVAFPAIGLFQLLDQAVRRIPDLISTYLNAWVAVGRLEEFMNEPDKDEPEDHQFETYPELQKASFAWPGSGLPVLHEVSLNVEAKKTVIGGKVGAGKTALLLSLLGELELLSGDCIRSNDIAYCEQRPWLQSMSIRENILFHTPYDDLRYRQVLEACALTPDLASFKHGDLSNIGENGIGLSGGQKARVALARAVYNHAKVLLLDDPLSALDHQTAASIVNRCFNGPLMADRKLVLVTHRLDLCRGIFDQYIEVVDGRVYSRPVASLPSIPDSGKTTKSTEEQEETTGKQMDTDAVPDKFLEDEHRAHGGIEFSVYWEYIKASTYRLWGFLIVAFIIYRSFAVGRNWFLKVWGEAYNRGDMRLMDLEDYFKDWPSPEIDADPWLLTFFLFAAGQYIFALISRVIMIAMAYTAGRRMFHQVIQRVAHATFRFYDVTPVGRLMNRMTSDIGTIDGDISDIFQDMTIFSIIWLSSAAVIAFITPLFLAFAVAMTVAFVMVFNRFLPSSQSLRRLEMTSLSPLLSDFSALADGLTTIRAFRVQSRFQDRVIATTDNFQRMDHFYWSLQAWLMYRFDNIAACAIFLLTVLGLYTAVSPGLLAFALTAASGFVSSTHSLCLCYGKLQMDFVSVERVVELLRLEQEPPGDVAPPASWPTYSGDIEFHDVTIRYAPHLDPALTNISFKIKGGTTTAIVGRTGSGKSTMAAALLGTVVPCSGSILIDGIDIARVDKHALRSRVTFLAQDPVLFPGRLRQNLDPLEEHTDEDCERVLYKVCGSHGWTLDTAVDTGGRNFSQGQRQLIGLARAILRRSAIVILDEATASIDLATSMQIQDVLREEMGESTVVTIAHRVEAVKDADSCLVLDKGTLVEHRAVGARA